MKTDNLISLNEAITFARSYTKKDVTQSNISYLINYGRINNFGDKKMIKIDKTELKKYYDSYYGKRELNWRSKLGDDIDWHLAFDQYKEAETTKHVHRLHPYKGKFIPQLVEYFLDRHIDEFKKEVYFNEGDIILDPFCGSGTTLIQANELGMHAIGIDISKFNSLISNVKVTKHNLFDLQIEIKNITETLQEYVYNSNIVEFEENLLSELNKFNSRFFPSPDYKRWVRDGKIEEKEYGKEKEKLFHPIFKELVNKYSIILNQKHNNTFLDKWYLQSVRNEINFIFEHVKKIKNKNIRRIIVVILSRTIRSCRATTHADLATLIDPVYETYYCSKHGKICKPLYSILNWWKRYSDDTLKRLSQFNKIRTETYQVCFDGDARNINLHNELDSFNENFLNIVKKKKIKGIFTSPPYVGLINYHEQHAYAYDLFGLDRKDDQEIGSQANGKSKLAREEYIVGVSNVLLNSIKWLTEEFEVFIVANDKFEMYPEIAQKTGLYIVQQFKRPVLNRTEKDKNAYSESIFHMRKK